jgi:thiol:disulfide interchange protein DsbD
MRPSYPHRMLIRTLIVLTIILGGLIPATAQNLNFLDEPVSIRYFVGYNSASPGGTLPVAVVLDIDGHWHINAHNVNDEYLIPTAVTVVPPAGLEILQIVYPPDIEKRLSFSDQPLALYDGEVTIGILLELADNLPPGDASLTVTVTYQACDDEKCIAPVDKQLTIPFRVSTPSEAIEPLHPEIFSNLKFDSEPATPEPAGEESGERSFGDDIASKGLFLAFLGVFIGGLALNLTPCIYPVIPITIGYFGAQSKGKTSYTMLLAVFYLLGMAIMYSSLGLVASLTGGLFGAALQNPIVLIIIALVMVGLSLSMFGVYEIQVPARLSNLAGTSKQGVVGAFFMGLTVGIVAAPCIGPFVLGLLTFVGENGNPLLGFSIFFTLAIGLGLPLVIIAILSGSIHKLPKSGQWMEWVRKLFGFILLGMALYFLRPLMPEWLAVYIVGGFAIVAGILLGFLIKAAGAGLIFRTVRKVLGAAFIIAGLAIIILPVIISEPESESKTETGVEWVPYQTELLERARADGKYVMIDFYADWCIPCKELDHKTFSHSAVVEASHDFIRLKADLTKTGSPATQELRREYRIRGVPTIVFIDQKGREITSLRLVGFENKDAFLARLKRLSTSAK